MEYAAIYRIRGNAPTLMQSDTLADPLAPETKRLREFSKKRVKTDDDHLAMAEIEWSANIYHQVDEGPGFPGANIHRMVLDAAKLRRKGTTIARAVMVMGDFFPISYDGPRDLEAMFNDPQRRFVDRRTVVVQKARVVRTRPIFHKWEMEFTLSFDPSQIDRAELDTIVADAGKYVGLGTYRPRFGRFDVI